MTGAGGFLGWHFRAAMLESGTDTRPVAMGDRFDLDTASATISGSSRFVHIAGVNRGSDSEVREGNVRFADQAASAIDHARIPPAVVVFANSTQSFGAGVYGEAKSDSAGILANAAQRVGAQFENVVLPNLFGEHGAPFYNSVTATFAHLLAEGGEPSVVEDKQLTLLHVQDAADLLGGSGAMMSELEQDILVSDLLATMRSMSGTYGKGEIPDVSTRFARNLFNTYRSYTFPAQAPMHLARHADARGTFFEILRSHGGDGQSSFSTTLPGVTRGDHFHRRKIERFTVLSGHATIALRKIFTGEIVEFDVSGDEPAAIDMPTMWVHNITNRSSEPLYTSFWTNDIFNPENPDTIAEAVHR